MPPTAKKVLDIVPGFKGDSEPPVRDLFELSQRLKPRAAGPVPRVVNPEPVSYRVGHKSAFWVSDLASNTVYSVEATLKVVSEHAYWYVDDNLAASANDLAEAAKIFESRVHPVVTGSFGDIWNPGVDNDPRLTILNTPLIAAAGYYGSQDEYSVHTHPHSNEREIIYIDGDRLRPGSDAYMGVLAHELQHAVHWNLDTGEDAWINEGLSEVAKELAGYPAEFVESFLRKPATQLNFWPDGIGTSAPHYGAASLFLSYLAQHYGGYEGLKVLAGQQADGIRGVNAYLEGTGKTFQDVYKDWIVANYLDSAEGRYGYADRDVSVKEVVFIFGFRERRDSLPQFSTRYLDIRVGQADALIEFKGEKEVALVSTECYSGERCWWSNRGDSIDATLTRELDLTGLSTATLEFRSWYRLEEGWDYAYVEVSTDGGETWSLLKGAHTTSENPAGNSYGEGFTGESEGWVRETIDISAYAGGRVLLRFEYITDDAVYLDGFVIDDIAVPEVGFFDDAEKERGWDAKGFVRTDNVLPQDYLVQVVLKRADGGAEVRDLLLDEDRRGQMLVEGLGSVIERAVVVISPVTPGTHQPARYTITVRKP